MPTLTRSHQIAIGLVLAALMAATRGYHFTSAQQWLPSASWAVFFLAGVYLRRVWVLGALLAFAGALDYTAINVGGVSDFCVSPAYVALLPAYGALWLAGRWYAGRCELRLATLAPLALAVVLGAAVCELVSSGSFYFYSGRITEPTFAEFGSQLAQYFPLSFAPMIFWVAAAGVVHLLLAGRYRGLDQSTVNPPPAD